MVQYLEILIPVELYLSDIFAGNGKHQINKTNCIYLWNFNSWTLYKTLNLDIQSKIKNLEAFC